MLLEGSWVHIDPCEAAVNEPLIYESWGKKPTYVLAYHSTEHSSEHSNMHSSDHSDNGDNENDSGERGVCDVTDYYVSDAAVIAGRRQAENISEIDFARLLGEANAQLLHY